VVQRQLGHPARPLGRRLDALIVRNVPNVRKAVKWNSPFYGIEGQVWFLGLHVFTHYARLFNSSLDGNARRAIDIHEGEELDAGAFKALIRAAVALNTSGGKARPRRAK
jgi:hypothetical protein